MDKIKKLFALMFVFMLCISFASAFDFNEVEFTKDDSTSEWGRYEIYDSQLLIFRGEQLATYELVDNGYDILTGWAELDIELFTEEQLFSEFNLYNRANKLTNLKELKIQYATLEKIVFEQKEYETICEDKKNPTPLTCRGIETGTYNITKEEWIYKDYNGEVLPVGKYKIKIKGKRENVETGLIDWIGITGAGNKELKEWAVWWDTDWANKQSIGINTSESISKGNISILINITYNASIMSSNFSDLRFLDEEEDEELGFWFENNNFIDSNSVEVWVMMNRNISSSANTTIYMYSNNPSVETTSDIENTFIFGDDFNLGSVDFTSKWVATNQGLYTTSNGEMVMASTSTSSELIQTNLTFSDGYSLEARVRTDEVSTNGLYMTYTGTSRATFTGSEAVDYVFENKFRATVGGNLNTGGSPVANVPYRFIGSIPSSGSVTVNITSDDKNTNLISKVATPSLTSGFIGSIRFAAGIGYIDWIYVREDYDFNKLSISFGSVEQSPFVIDINLISPIDGFNSTVEGINFSCSVESDTPILNLSLIIDDTFNETIFNTTSNQNLSISRNLTIEEGNHNWTCQGCIELGCTTQTASDFTIHLTAPTINITEPTGQINKFTLGDNQTISWQVSETGQNLTEHITNCSYIYNEIETQVNLSDCLIVNTTSFLYVQRVNNLTFTSTDNFGIVASNFTSWTYLLLELNQTFNNQTTEGNQEDFRADLIVDGYIISEAIFNYNNTNYTTNIFSSGEEYIITSSILIPSVESETNFSFLFYVDIEGQTYSLTSHNQSVGNVNLSVCSPGDNLLLNMSLKDEITKFDIVGTIEINAQAISKTSNEIVASASTNFSNISSGAICLNPLESFSDLYLDAEIKYYSDGYAPELYHIQKADMSEYPKNLSLFDLNNNYSTNFIVTYQDDNLITVEGAVVQLQRKYISEDIFEVVEAPLTSDSGKVILHIDLNSNKYKATVVKDGEVLDIFDNLVFSCDNELVGECTQTLLGKIDPQNDIPVITLRDFSYFLTTNNNSIITTFSIPSGTPSTVNIQLDQYDLLGVSSRCNKTVISSGGSIECTFNDSIGNSILDLRIYKEGEEQGNKGYIVEDNASTIFSGNNFIILIIVLLSLVGMAFSNPIGIVIVAILTFVIGGALWLINGFSFVVGLGAFFWLLGAGIVIIFKMNKQEDR